MGELPRVVKTGKPESGKAETGCHELILRTIRKKKRRECDELRNSEE